MEPITTTALRQRVEDLKALLDTERATILRIVESVDSQGTDVAYQIRSILENYFNTGAVE